jgi:hypothetical protein
MRKTRLVLTVILLVNSCMAQQLTTRMTDQDVLAMAALGLSDDVIIDKIHATAETNFDTSVEGMRQLKFGKVSDSVIRVMINPRMTTGARDSVATPMVSGSVLPEDAGIFVVVGDQSRELEPEIVNWQTGGVAKSHVTIGIVKGDLNGKVAGPQSPTQVNSSVVFLIKTVEGTSATEYQLLRLHQKADRREFRSVTGGVLHQSGGAQRDKLSFSPEKVGGRLWKVRLDDLPTGEYGFLAPGVLSASLSSSGKIYSFSVAEGGQGTAAHQSTEGYWNSSRNADSPKPAASASPGRDPVYTNTSIGGSSDGNPAVRHDGVILTNVIANGPADRAGVKVGDVVLAINDHYLFTADEFAAEVHRCKPGTKVALRYRCHATIYDTYVTLGAE